MIEISEILYRWMKGLKIKAIARSLAYSKNSVKNIIRQAEAFGLTTNLPHEKFEAIIHKIDQERYGKSKLQHTQLHQHLALYHDRISAWLKNPSITITQIYRLIEESGFKTSESTIRRYIKEKFPEAQKKHYTVHLPSIPGQEAQVDYAYVGLMKDPVSGKQRKTYAFVMTLSYSRYRVTVHGFLANL